MTAPANPAAFAPTGRGGPVVGEASVTDDFIAEVVQGYDQGLPDPNDPNDTEQVPAHEPGAAPKKTDPAPAKTEKSEPEPKAEGKEGEPEPAAAEATPLKLATEFTLYDQDGDELDIADVMTKVKEIGIPYKGEVRKLPLDRVVRLAQAGFSNQKVYDQAQDAIKNYDSLEADFTNANESIARQNTFIERLLTDEHSLQQAREKFAQFNSPESRAERAERRAKELETRIAEGSKTTGSPTSFYENDVKPVLVGLLDKYKDSISADELTGRFQRLTAKFGKVIAPSDFPAVKEILTDLADWAAGTHEDRMTTSQAVRKAKEETTLLKKRVASGARPTGRVATAADGTKPKKVHRPGSDDAIEDLVTSALADGVED